MSTTTQILQAINPAQLTTQDLKNLSDAIVEEASSESGGGWATTGTTTLTGNVLINADDHSLLFLSSSIALGTDNANIEIDDAGQTIQLTGEVGIGGAAVGGVSLSVTGDVSIKNNLTGDNVLLITNTLNEEQAYLGVTNITGDDNYASLNLTTTDTVANTIIRADFNDGTKEAQILLEANATEGIITITAPDGITLNENGGEVGIGGAAVDGVALSVVGDVVIKNKASNTDALVISSTINNEQSYLKAQNATGDGNNAFATLATTDTSASLQIIADFNDGVKTARIDLIANATEAKITLTAPNGIKADQAIPSYANNAAALAAIGAGKLYYTDVAGEYIVKMSH